jgi:hypothetical protein
VLSERPLCANTARSPTAWRTGEIDLKRATSLVQNLQTVRKDSWTYAGQGGEDEVAGGQVPRRVRDGRRAAHQIPRLAPKAASLTRVARAARRGYLRRCAKRAREKRTSSRETGAQPLGPQDRKLVLEASCGNVALSCALDMLNRLGCASCVTALTGTAADKMLSTSRAQ